LLIHTVYNHNKNWGVDESRITISGMAVQGKWHESLSPRLALLEELRLPTDKKIVLLSGGAMFTCGPIVEIARSLARARDDICVVALAGRSKKLLARLAALADSRAGKIVPVGFTDNMHKYVALASLVITKAGGATTAECLARPAAMVLLKPVPGQERDNAEFFASQGAAVIARNDNHHAWDGVVGIVRQLLSDPARLEKMRIVAAGLYRPGRETIAQSIVDYVRQNPRISQAM
jgi:processive 1,2-diacylglycerol beta-glucosyltransferase